MRRLDGASINPEAPACTASEEMRRLDGASINPEAPACTAPEG
jgi:hypothetical protein